MRRNNLSCSIDVYKRQSHHFYEAVTYTVEVKATSKWGTIKNYEGKNTITAVSYTHLDVYKRQPGDLAKASAVAVDSSVRNYPAPPEVCPSEEDLSLIHI